MKKILITLKDTQENILVTDEGSKAGMLTLFPNTLNGVPDFKECTSNHIRLARWNYAANGSGNFRVVERNIIIPK